MAAGSRVKVALLCLVAVFAAGCGSSGSQDAASDNSAPTTSVKAPSNTTDPSRAEISTSWMLLFSDEGTKSEPPQTLYDVFRREQTDDEAKMAPEVVAEASCSMELPSGSRHIDYGKPIADKARILLDGIGPGDNSLVAVPTTANAVSVAVFPGGGGSCVRPSANGLIVAAEGNGDSVNVYGMVDDRVQAVDVITAGQTHHADLGENGFAAALPGGSEQHLDKLVLHREDGSKTEVPLG